MGISTRHFWIFNALPCCGTDAETQSEAYFWIGKTQAAKNDLASALTSWETAARVDPTGYYGIRSRQKILNEEPFTVSTNYDLGFDLVSERAQAKEWMTSTFNLSSDQPG